MRILKAVGACFAALALMSIPAIQAYQADTTAGTATKKVKKKASEAATTGDQAATQATETAKKAVPAPTKVVSDSEIAAAKASGKVWVNTDTGVYHKGGKWYGATKQGKFMAEDDAIKAGYHASKTK